MNFDATEEELFKAATLLIQVRHLLNVLTVFNIAVGNTVEERRLFDKSEWNRLADINRDLFRLYDNIKLDLFGLQNNDYGVALGMVEKSFDTALVFRDNS